MVILESFSITLSHWGRWSQVVIPNENAFNPYFLSALLIGLSCFFGFLGGYQLLVMKRRKTHGKYLNIKSEGFYHILRLGLVTLQGFLTAILCYYQATQNTKDFANLSTVGLACSFTLIVFVLLPLHIIEVHKSIWQLATPLLYWVLNPFMLSAGLYQNNYTDYSMSPNSTFNKIEILLFINSVFVALMEAVFWKRAHEFTYDLKLNGVNDSSIFYSNVLARVSYTNLNHLVSKCYKTGKVEFEDLPDVGENLKVENCAKKVKEFLEKDPSLLKALVKAFKSNIVLCVFFSSSWAVSVFAHPWLLQQLLSIFTGSAEDKSSQILYGFLICVSMMVMAFVGLILFNECYNYSFQLGYQVSLSLSFLIYEKSLKLSTKSRGERTTGDIVNLISVDVTKVMQSLRQSFMLISGPFQILISIGFLYRLVGWSSFFGILVIISATPGNIYIIRRYEVVSDNIMKFKDMRTKAVSELLNSIKSIKLYSWEKPMSEKISHIRNKKELKEIKIMGIINSLAFFSFGCVPYFTSCATFAAFSLISGQKLTSELVFPCLNVFDLLAAPLLDFPDILSIFIEAKVSLKRIIDFLDSDELDQSLVQKLNEVKTNGDTSVEINNATFLRSEFKKTRTIDEHVDNNSVHTESIVESAPVIALSNINFAAKKGQLTCIVGSVGSGKSTFLHSLLGQFPMVSGGASNVPPSLHVRGKITYCSQHPWTMNASIKKNILFGHKYDPEFFEKTIEACQLKSDFEILPDGEETQVGERGISLSGGQKARVSLARAVYARADIYLLDDVLSAVDAHVSKNIIEQVFSKNGILASKTLILSTNNIHVLEEADNIYVLDHGKIDEQGTYDELIKNKGEFAKLIEEFGNAKAEEEKEEKEKEECQKVELTNIAEVVEDDDSDVVVEIEESGLELSRIPTRATIRRASMAAFEHRFHADNEKTEGKITGQTKEISKTGGVGWSTYKRAAKAAGYWNVIITACFLAISIIAEFCGKLWMKHWADTMDLSTDDDASSSSTSYLVSVYCIIGVVSATFSLVSGIAFWYFSCATASKVLHQDLVSAIIKSPMSFFETTPTGRILNRFSEDISKFDTQFPHAVYVFGIVVLKSAYCLGMIVFSLPTSIFALAGLGYIFYYIQVYYIVASRETKRFDSVTKSPVYSHVHESLVGVDTIRAFGQESRFEFINSSNLNHNLAGGIASVWMTRWLGFRLKSVSAILVFIICFLCVASLATSTPFSAGVVGILTLFILQVTDEFIWLVRMGVEVENSGVSIERILEYCDLPSERPYVIENSRPPIQWPMNGGIKFQNYTTKYNAEAKPVLNNVSFEVKPQEKVGIVGRTGAGKSTLTLALFRIIEATGGSIIVDGVDTSKMGLYDLRSKLNIIPQDSQAFEGTVRQNLDPFYKYKDEELWKVLEMAHLKNHVMSMKDDESKKDNQEQGDSSDIQEGAGKGLYAKVNEGGSNLSAGQKQLLCLARALLNPSRILILDEATAAVDVKTDKIVQETIRNKFNDRTILTIAHRIDTIMDNDKILVLDRGEVKEFDSPANLLKNKDSLFYSLCESGGYLKQ
ncbi:hypothetical protein DASC09_015180 [Saccharomycopsis crataegensis]|uniref:Uncharacterized protein n=1 Tax=Saccharomycopsis crataegensis TaxID=43959 RepID=A0AAV5QHE9_9ASCO|nr:hypothetical protein DASC09_015180 [Saccharomycopsis crataegensis]